VEWIVFVTCYEAETGKLYFRESVGQWEVEANYGGRDCGISLE